MGTLRKRSTIAKNIQRHSLIIAMANQAVNYQFLLLTHIVCADQQIHSEEAKALRELAKVVEIDEYTQEEMEKILSQDSSHLCVEVLTDLVAHNNREDTMRQILALASIDGYLAPPERELVNQICQYWNWKPEKIDKLVEQAESFKPKPFLKRNGNDESTELSFAARMLKNEKNSPLAKAIIDFATRLAPETIGQTIKKLEREILLAGPEYDLAISQCAKIAGEDYQFTLLALDNAESALKELDDNLKQTIQKIKVSSSDERKAKTASDVSTQLEESRQSLAVEIIKSLESVKQSLNAKHRALNYFSIAFMGRTKAGKSTLHAIITGEGWDGIGVGKQRTTRLNRVYEWRNIRVIDTPGIGAPGGKSDEEIAKSIIDESDVVCYVVTNDSIQETEFQFLKLLKEKAKPLVIVLNVKYNLRDNRRLEHFMNNPEKLFAMEGNSGLNGHIERINRYAKDHYANNYFPIIPVMLLAAQMSREKENQEIDKTLFEASKMQYFLDTIRESLIKHGAIRRSQTLLGSTVGDIDNPNKWVKQQTQIYELLTSTLNSKLQIIKDKTQKSKEDNSKYLKFQVNTIFVSLNNSI